MKKKKKKKGNNYIQMKKYVYMYVCMRVYCICYLKMRWMDINERLRG